MNMHEGMNNGIEPKPEYTRKSFTSNLENADGNFESFSIRLDKDGKPPLIVFEDIDKTLLHLEPTYKEIRKAMWPEAVSKDGIEEVGRVHLAGFRLGTMWRELYRMHAIYNLGKTEWKNPDKYEEEFLAVGKDGENIDEPNDPLHIECDKLLEKFDDIAASTVEKQAKENPNFFDEAKIQPIYKLNALYKRLGVVIVGMTANPKKFANALCKYAGLGESFIDCATDTDVPGKKEYKMQYLIKQLEAKGIKIPYDKILIIGDSPLGDVGSGSKFQKLEKEEHPEVRTKGIVINGNEEDLIVAINKLKETTDMEINAIDVNQVPIDKHGNPDLTQKGRDKFYTEINTLK
ncbi:MAG: HAD family hydrolase [Candidatus Nomurabacteria bacterium]|nr:HAD family hydrolase [Candidatus Nomurabacteria bacterium]